MTSYSLVCQECGNLTPDDLTIKVSGEGFVCTQCLEKWIHGEDNVI